MDCGPETAVPADFVTLPDATTATCEAVAFPDPVGENLVGDPIFTTQFDADSLQACAALCQAPLMDVCSWLSVSGICLGAAGAACAARQVAPSERVVTWFTCGGAGSGEVLPEASAGATVAAAGESAAATAADAADGALAAPVDTSAAVPVQGAAVLVVSAATVAGLATLVASV